MGVPLWEFAILKSGMILIALIGCIGWFIVGDIVCLRTWKPADTKVVGELLYCTVAPNDASTFLLIFLVVSAITLMIIYGVIFWRRLRKIFVNHDSTLNVHLNQRTKLLIVKNGILTIFAALMTIISYTMYCLTFMGKWAYWDAVSKVICIGLMFAHNDHQYRVLCRC